MLANAGKTQDEADEALDAETGADEG
jgi:hypothetical protein